MERIKKATRQSFGEAIASLKNEKIVVLVENGGSGASIAGPVANRVLQKCKEVLN